MSEMDRMQNNLQKQIDQVKKNQDEINQYFRTTKLENDNITLLLRMISDLNKRVEELEKRTA